LIDNFYFLWNIKVYLVKVKELMGCAKSIASSGNVVMPRAMPVVLCSMLFALCKREQLNREKNRVTGTNKHPKRLRSAIGQ
jgi:hypothetical protein